MNWPKALRALDVMQGVVCAVSDDAILDEKARIGRHGYGCEPASAASLAGLRQLMERGTIGADDRVVCILTGHQLKDSDATIDYHAASDGDAADHGERSGRGSGPRSYANPPIRVANDIDAICRAIEAGAM